MAVWPPSPVVETTQSVGEATRAYPIVTLLDDTGAVVWVNQAWLTFGAENGMPSAYRSVGANYLDVARRAESDYASRAADGITAVLEGQASYSLVYPCHSPTATRWFRLHATAVRLEGRTYCLVTHQNVTREHEASSNHSPHPPVSERPSNRSPLVTYSPSADEPFVEALTEAFEALGVDLFDRRTTLHDWVDLDAVDAMWGRDSDFTLSVHVHDYLVVVTPETLHIYNA